MKIWVATGGMIPHDWAPTFKELKRIDPDKVFILSNTEVYIEGNWGVFLDMLQPWLEEKGIIATIITPHLNNVYVRPNIIAEQSYAMVESVLQLYQDIEFGRMSFKKPFSCYMFRPSESRGRVLDELVRQELHKKGFVTYHNTKVRAYKEFKNYRKKPLILKDETYTKNSEKQFTAPYRYRDAFLDIVTETSYEEGLYFMTEKTIRAIMHKRPFIAIASPGYHKNYLQKVFGLELYDEFLNYSFDSQPDLQTRIQQSLVNVHKLLPFNRKQLAAIYKRLEPKLEYNKQRLLYIYNNPSQIIPPSMQFMLGNNDYELYGMKEVSLFSKIEEYRRTDG